MRPFALDLRALALFRVGLGIGALLVAVDGIRSLSLLDSRCPIPAELLTGPLRASIHTWAASRPGALTGLLVVHVIASLLLSLGWQSRAMTLLVLLLSASIQNRMHLSMFSGDTLLRALLIWSLLLPVSSRWSLDARRNGNAHQESASLIPSLGLWVQMSLLFVTSGLQKLRSPAWLDGSALEVVLGSYFYARPFGVVLHDSLPAGLLQFLTFLTLAIEMFVPFAFFLPQWRARATAVFLCIALMIGVWLTMAVGTFPLISIAGFVALLPSEVFSSAQAEGVSTVRPGTSSRAWTSRLAAAAASTCVLLSVLSSVGNLLRLPVKDVAPGWLSVTGLVQNWGMFRAASELPRGFVRVAGPARDRPETILDVWTGAPVQDDEVTPPLVELLPFREMRLWESMLRDPQTNAPLIPSVGRWACAAAAEKGQPVTEVRAIYVEETDEGFATQEMFRVPCGGP